ncbi:hypothetical protein BO94DRAFT_7369 [Aspergillus sclerotioniger CBS 115572]|uniref:Uncharacterized protein n=1 Tax=Aspergillus sclerotioniger CBS 115572 TaxID=1450535 RepID=A0A317XGF3_9EURO|nr:hypothetical protein BO94DRAFT_7369 [Aspergillus sclerotioniger CBS 115572]PWY96358.1 hypothetical protein BO94DRAFT_7369 [Aspergillus sclerotioniger CBS 115572]
MLYMEYFRETRHQRWRARLIPADDVATGDSFEPGTRTHLSRLPHLLSILWSQLLGCLPPVSEKSWGYGPIR